MAAMPSEAPKPLPPQLWTHPAPDSTRMAEFMRAVNQKHGLRLDSYADLYQWSIDHISQFWADIWDFTGVTAERCYDQVGGATESRVSVYIYPGVYLSAWCPGMVSIGVLTLRRWCRWKLPSSPDQTSLRDPV